MLRAWVLSAGVRLKVWLLAMLVLVGVAAGTMGTAAQKLPVPDPEPLAVVVSFSILGDMVNQIGGDHVEVTSLMGLGGDPHAFEPAPEQIRALSNAQLLVINGMGFEPWLERLVAASNFKGQIAVASEGVTPRFLDTPGNKQTNDQTKDQAKIDPHAWQSLCNGVIYARNILAALVKADPADEASYRDRAKLYLTEMQKLDEEVHQALRAIAPEKRRVIVPHDALGYFGRDYGIEFVPIMGASSLAEASASKVAQTVRMVKKSGAAAVFLESGANPKLMEQIARETGLKVGGLFYTDTLSAPGEPAGTYLGLVKWNAGKLIYALSQE